MTKILTIAKIVWLEMLRRKEIYVLGILLAAGLLLLISLNIFGLGSISGYIADIGFLMTWILGWVLSINIAGRQIPQEETRGTVFALLAKPIGRGQLLFGKWLGAWSVVTGSIACFYLLTLIIVFVYGGHVEAVTLFQAVTLHAMLLGILCALSIALSIRLTHDAAATLTYIATAAMFAFVPRIPEFVTGTKSLRETAMLLLYVALPHFELFDMRQRVIHLHGPIGWTAWATIMIYGVLLIAIFLLVAGLAFRNKQFSRSNKE